MTSYLVLGGTSWLGGAVARHALARDLDVTCLARGEAGAPPDGVRWVRADRTRDDAYAEVADRSWDVVLDVSWQPDQVRSAAAALGDRAAHWVYVSSCSVYADDTHPGADESDRLHEPHVGEGPVDWEVYGPAKVACENALVDALGADRVLSARAGLITGHGDRSDRFGYWPARAARAAAAGDGAPVLVPPLGSAFQGVDVEDLAAWLVDAGLRRVAGMMNAIGPQTTVGAVVDASAAAAGARPSYREAEDGWLLGQGVAPWAGPESLPLWLPQQDYAGFMTRTNTLAVEAGLLFRPLEDTVAASLAWERERGLDRERRAGLTPAREAELLAALG